MTSRSPRLLTRHLPALAAAVAGLVLFLLWGNAVRGYIPTRSLFFWWGFQWSNPASECQQGWVVLALAGFLAVRNLRAGRACPGARELSLGTAVVAGALALHALGYHLQQTRLSLLALLGYLWGVAWLAGGRPWARATAFPLALMLFAVPTGLVDTASFWLRLGVIDASQAIVGAAGFHVLRSGTQLFAADGRYQFDVVAACSGIRSLEAIAALSLVAGYLYLRRWPSRLAVLALSIPCAAAGNIVRLVSIIVSAEQGGRAAGVRTHEQAGWFVWIVVAGLVGGAIALARRLERTMAPVRESGPEQAGPAATAGRRVASAAMVAAAGLATASLLAWLDAHDRPVGAGVALAPGGRDPVALPVFLGSSWAGRRQEPGAVEREVLPPDTGFSRILYLSLDAPGQGVLVSVVLSGADRSSLHRPELCLLAQGWSLGPSEVRRFGNPEPGRAPVAATVVHVGKRLPGSSGGPEPGLVAYWFIGAGESVPTTGGRLWRDVLARLRGRPERWAYVLLQTGARDGDAAALARLQSVIDGILPVLTPASAPGPGGAAASPAVPGRG